MPGPPDEGPPRRAPSVVHAAAPLRVLPARWCVRAVGRGCVPCRCAMAEPDPEDVAAAAAEGADVEELELASCMGVPSSLCSLLAGLLADKVCIRRPCRMPHVHTCICASVHVCLRACAHGHCVHVHVQVLEVRTSALHAIKTLCKKRPLLLRVSSGKFAALLAPGVVGGCQDARHMPVQSAAKRTMMHLLGATGWAADVELSAAQLRADGASAQYVAEFAKRSYKRLAGIESELELSDEDA